MSEVVGSAPAPRRLRDRLRERASREPMLVVAVSMLTLLVALAVAPGAFTRTDPRDCDLDRSREPPSLDHPFGIDTLGCDYLAQTIYGTRTSLSVAVLTLVVTVSVALVLGGLAGYRGGWLDTVVSRSTDAWASVPLLLGGVVVLTSTEQRGILQVSLVLALFGWPAMVRLVRTSVTTTASRDHVLAARALGAGSWRVLRRPVLPLSTRPLVAYDTKQPGQAPDAAAVEGVSRLVPVRVVASAAKPRRQLIVAGADDLLELALPSGARVRFPAGTDVAYLRALVAAL